MAPATYLKRVQQALHELVNDYQLAFPVGFLILRILGPVDPLNVRYRGRSESRIRAALNHEARSRRITIDREQSPALLTVTSDGQKFYHAFGSEPVYEDGDVRLTRMTVQQLHHHAAAFKLVLEDIQQTFLEFYPNNTGAQDLNTLPDAVNTFLFLSPPPSPTLFVALAHAMLSQSPDCAPMDISVAAILKGFANSTMIEPETPVTLKITYSRRPAFLLESDEGKPLPAASVIMRYRHLRQQQRIIQSGIAPGEGSGSRATRGIIVATAESREPASVPAGQNDQSVPTAQNGSAPPSAIANVVPEAPAAALGAAPHSSDTVDGSTGSGGSHVKSSSILTASTRTIPPTRGHLGLDDSAHDRRETVMTSIGPLEITYTWRNLRSRGEKTRGEKTYWFASRATDVLDVPPTLALAKPGDLYIHTSNNGSKQAWLRATTPTWTSVELLHPHPFLRGYVLNFLKNGEPSWVTKDTVRTYMGRIEKRKREAKKG
ncbi:hypothetical protein K466DRAFT_606294 [Polyporus arcularius HHB13444]|uniref:Uncharacterized protein n=1 Tax=Polyporus arcularius HHB13444 TaxID=1314778 RepID=A0A5C3NNL8_9APHY|nr:hypothetical protein K466DRAFT_606294 [Polyporus arcularius HHB13444]